MNRRGKFQYIIEEKGQLFLIKQNKNIVVIPTEDMKWIIEKSRKNIIINFMSQRVLGSAEIKSKEVEKSNKKKSNQIAGNNVFQCPTGPGQLLFAILEPLLPSSVCRLGGKVNDRVGQGIQRLSGMDVCRFLPRPG